MLVYRLLPQLSAMIITVGWSKIGGLIVVCAVVQTFSAVVQTSAVFALR